MSTGARPAKADVSKAQRLLRELFEYFAAHPGEMGDEARQSPMPARQACSAPSAIFWRG